jgi:hypothetical protein
MPLVLREQVMRPVPGCQDHDGRVGDQHVNET